MSDLARELRALLSEIKRRRVFRVAVAYAVVVFVVIQAADLLVPALLLPDWVFRAVVLAGLLGFPVAIVLAWAFDLTPEGLRRTPATGDRAGSNAGGPARPTLRVGGALVVLLGVGTAAWLLWPDDPGAVASDSRSPTESEATPPSVAVLPFDNLSGGEESRYFSDGMTEDILTQLSKIGDLTVISRQSVIQYRDSEKSMGEIAEELGASHVVEGSVRRAGATVRVTAQLIEAHTDWHVWAEQYDRAYDAEGVFDIQTEVAGEIARALHGTLSPEERGRMAGAPTHDVTAYDYLLRGREFAQRGTREDLERAVAFFRQAIDEDPDYAQAHAALGGAFTALVGGTGAAPHFLDSAEVAARKALELDPDAPESHSALALVFWNSGRITEAVATYRRVLQLSPNEPTALWGLAFALWLQGDLDDAVRFAERARTVNPAAPNTGALLGRCYASLRLFQEAEREFRRVLQLQPDNPWAHEDLVWTYVAQGDHASAREQLRTLGALRPDSWEFHENSGSLALIEGDYAEARRHFETVLDLYPERELRVRAALGSVHQGLGDEGTARELLREAAESWEEARRQAGDDYGATLRLGRARARLGERDEAVRRLEEAYDLGWRGWPTIDIGLDPSFIGLASDPGFQALRSRILEDVEEARTNVQGPSGEIP